MNHLSRLETLLSDDAGASEIVPSSGFTLRAMEAVRLSVIAPPIPFPWSRVLPWAVAALGMVAASEAGITRAGGTALSAVEVPPALQAVVEGLATPDTAWVALGLLAAAVSVASALRAGEWRRP